MCLFYIDCLCGCLVLFCVCLVSWSRAHSSRVISLCQWSECFVLYVVLSLSLSLYPSHTLYANTHAFLCTRFKLQATTIIIPSLYVYYRIYYLWQVCVCFCGICVYRLGWCWCSHITHLWSQYWSSIDDDDDGCACLWLFLSKLAVRLFGRWWSCVLPTN